MRKHKKIGGKHTTLIPFAEKICTLLCSHDSVTKVTLGFISTKLKSLSGKKRIKIKKLSESSAEIIVRGIISQQILIVTCDDIESLASFLKQSAESKKGSEFLVVVE